MKQRTAVRALVRRNDQTLLMRRANGRASILGKFELPGGKIEHSEQPEEALRRYLVKDAGLAPVSVQLFDVISYIDPDDHGLQYVFIVYLVTVENATVSLSENYDKAIWQSKSKIQHRDITESSQVLLGLSEQSISTCCDEPYDFDRIYIIQQCLQFYRVQQSLFSERAHLIVRGFSRPPSQPFLCPLCLNPMTIRS